MFDYDKSSDFSGCLAALVKRPQSFAVPYHPYREAVKKLILAGYLDLNSPPNLTAEGRAYCVERRILLPEDWALQQKRDKALAILAKDIRVPSLRRFNR